MAGAGARGRSLNPPPLAKIEAELDAAFAAGLTLVAKGEPAYPPLLAQVEASPPLLYFKGRPDFWTFPPIAVVGARRASAAGLKFAGELSGELACRGFAVVSGLARGIDAAAHRAALPFATCAVLPGGLDEVYPPEHGSLAKEIAEAGALLSECPPGFQARAQDFPRRNRIISGVSLGVVIVEAAAKSGSLITARLAAEQNRDVFAVPGHPYEARAAGTNALIKEGAICTTSVEDVIAALRLGDWRPSNALAIPSANPALSSPRHAPAEVGVLPELEEMAAKLISLLSVVPVDIDELCRLTGREAREVTTALSSLELLGKVTRRGRSVALVCR
jgi:DNA processing protein